jgi:hypothetical protein
MTTGAGMELEASGPRFLWLAPARVAAICGNLVPKDTIA